MLELFKTLKLDKSEKLPLYTQLYELIKEMITNGTLIPDFKLPSVRQLVELLHVNQVTVVSAFKRLELEGYVYKKSGSGTFVSNTLDTPCHNDQPDRNIILDELYHQDDMPIISGSQIKIGENTVNFASATPTPDLFPVEDFKVSLNEVLERDKGNAFGYQESQGYLPLRESIGSILESSSISADPEDIQVISGAQQGIDIISKALLKSGDFIITESPTYTGAIAVFKSRGAEIVDIDIGKDGLDLNILEYNLKKYSPRLIYAIPSFQNPTGYSYSNYKRAEVLKLAEKYDAYIIEDDYVSDLDFDGKNFMPLKAADKYDRVIYIKSFSKIFMPGLRLGFMISPRKLRTNILEAKHTTDISTSGLIQRAFDNYIRKGFWDRHYSFMYSIYWERYEKMIEALDKYLPSGIKYVKPGGGLNIWLDMPYGFPINRLFRSSVSSDVIFAPGKIFYTNNTPSKANNIRLSFAAVHTEQVEDGIKKLCSLMDMLMYVRDKHENVPLL